MDKNYNSFLKQTLLKLISRFCFAGFLLGFAFTPVLAQSDLSFSPTSLSFTVVQGGSTANQSSDLLSSSALTPIVISLNKSANSEWLVLPTVLEPLALDLGLVPLSFGINSSGLAPGDYSATVTASAFGHNDATLVVNLTVTAPPPPVLSFTPTSLSFSVAEDGNTANKTSTLSANTGAPTDLTLTKSVNSNWLVLPSDVTLDELSFGINAEGLVPGNYNSTVTASANGYANATLTVTLVVTAAPALSFTPTSLSFSVAEDGNTANKTSTLSANTGAPTDLTLTKSANSNWLVLPSDVTLDELSFGINAEGLVPGNYNSTVTASANGYANATLTVTLSVTAAPALSFTPTSLSFSVAEDGNTANKTSTLSANTGAPTDLTLTKSANSNWLLE